MSWLGEVGSTLGDGVDAVTGFASKVGDTIGDVADAAGDRLSGLLDGEMAGEAITAVGALVARLGGATGFVEDNFDGMSHEQIMAAVAQMEPGVVDASAEGWKAIGDALSQGLGDFGAAIQREIFGDGRAGWEGTAAAAALDATNRYTTASNELAEAGNVVGATVQAAASAIGRVKAQVPPPVNVSAYEVANWDVRAAGLKLAMYERNEAHQQAVQVMKSVYNPAMRDAYGGVPALPEPPTVTRGTGGGGGSGAAEGPGTWSGSETGQGTGTTPGSGQGETTAPQAPTADDQAAAPGEGDAAAPAVNGPQAGESGTAATGGGLPGGAAPDDATVRAAGVAPDRVGSGLAGTGSGASGSGHGTATSGYGAGGTGGSGSAGSYGGGAGGYGNSGFVATPGATPIAAGTAAGSAPAVAGAAGRPGAPGAGMMPGAGARGGCDDDTEHTTPGYLVTVDNGNELVGSIPLVAPPVLGA